MRLYPLIRPFAFALDPERAHRMTIGALKLMPARRPPDFPLSLKTRVAGIEFPTPVGLAAGFDKDAEVPEQMLWLGFGFVEVGTLTPRAQMGNPKPRLFRLKEDRAIINRLGFNNGGEPAAYGRLRECQHLPGVIGVNVGANKDSKDRIADYVDGVRSMAPVARYLTINISSPNTPGLRTLQNEGALEELLAAIRDSAVKKPVFLKVAPDLTSSDPERIVRAAIDYGIDAIIVSNTTISRPPLKSRYAAQAGGLSGAPLKDLALDALCKFRRASGGEIPLIGVGGIASAEDAWQRIRAGASLVQLYSAMVYEGPGIAARIARDLARKLKLEGMASIADAVGERVAAGRMRRLVLGSLFALLLLSWNVPASARAGRAARTPVQAGIVSAADPRAAAAGVEMLRRGGSATDAAIATMLLLNVVEPQNSGIGGGGFFLRSDGKTHRLASIDGRETAPGAARPDWFLGPGGKPLPPQQIYVGGKSAGVPGALAMMALAHERYGRLPWASLFEPAIRMARGGFIVSARMHNGLSLYGRHATGWARQAYFGADGQPVAEGALLRLPALANTLEAIARKGARSFYRGAMAQKIAGALDTAEQNPSKMTASDISNYRAKDRQEVCERYRAYRICGIGPPSGGIVVLMILKQLERFNLAALGRNSPVAWHLLAESERLAYADRDTYLADPDFVSVPVQGLLDPAYLAGRSALIQRDRTLADIEPGTPAGAPPRVRAPSRDDPGTSDLAVADSQGNVVEVTTTINGYFGSGIAVAGFMINNELPDFDPVPVRNGYFVANRVEGGKRPRSSMSPIIVYGPDGRERVAIGAAGGATIICQVAKALIGILDWKMSAQDAIAMGLVFAPGKTATIEKGTELEAMLPALQALGENVRIAPLGLKANAIEYVGGRWVGAADPRSEGVAMDISGHVTRIVRRANDLNGAHE